MKRSAVALASTLLAAVCWGQEEAGRGREELFRMVDAYVMSHLQESVGLSDQQFVEVLPLVKKLQGHRRSYVQKRHGILREMRLQFESGRATEERIAGLLRELKTLEAEEPAAIRRDVEAIDARLDPLQQAKLRLLEVRVEQRLRELMNRVREERQSGRRPRN